MSYHLLLPFWLLLPAVLHAAVFKCISPGGQHSYQDQPCPADHAAHAMRGSYFSLISREPYQIHADKQQQQQQARQDAVRQQEQGKARKLQQRQRQQKQKNCTQLRNRQRQLAGQLQPFCLANTAFAGAACQSAAGLAGCSMYSMMRDHHAQLCF